MGRRARNAEGKKEGEHDDDEADWDLEGRKLVEEIAMGA